MTDEQYYTLIHPYQDAMNLILTRLKILNHTTYESEDFQPIHSITNRIKEKGVLKINYAKNMHPQVCRMPRHSCRTLPECA